MVLSPSLHACRAGGDVGVVVITVYVGADAIAVIIADAGAGGGVPDTVAVGVDEVVGGVVAIVLIGSGLGGDIGVVVNGHIGANAIAVVIADAGAKAVGSRCSYRHGCWSSVHR